MEADIKNIPILTYHKIDDRQEWGINTVKVSKFHQQMEFLREENYTPINFLQLEKIELPPKPVIITFDDGYQSVYQNAFPILKKFRFTAVIFVITNFIGRLNLWDANLGGVRFAHLNQQQTIELAKAGMEIASHGLTHRSLNNLHKSEVISELQRSKTFLEELTGTPVKTIAYPFGMHNHEIIEIARNTGYHFGCINLWTNNYPIGNMCLRRIPVYRSDSKASFKRKLSANFSQKLEFAKLRVLSWPARLTPIYQKLVNKTAF